MAKKVMAKKTKKSAPKTRTKVVRAEVVDEDSEAQADIEPIIEQEPEHLAELPALLTSKEISTSKDPIAIYLQEIRKYPILTREQEQEVAKKYYETKDPAAAQALVTSNLRFVVKIAAEYSKFGAKLIDLIQEGNLGLMHAVRDFNPNKGVKLITYAVWWIRGYIQDYLMKQYSLVRIGTTQNQKKLFYQLQKQKEALESLADSPQLAIISQRTGIDPSEIKEMAQRLSGRDVSLDKSTNYDGGDTFLSRQKDLNLPPDESLALKENLNLLSEIVEKLTPKLSPKEKIILDERILNDEPLTLQEIGDKYKITREAVRQSENRLMTKIKNEFLAAHKTEPG